MYTFNIFIYGHRLANNEEINALVHAFDLEFRKTINDKRFEVSTPYHGGQVAGDLRSIIFGTNITDDDHNPNFVTKVRSVKEEDYKKDYTEFLELFKRDLLDNKGLGEDDYDEAVDKIIVFLDSTNPEFYTIEVSS